MIVVIIAAIIAFFVVLSFINTWLKALLAGAPVSMLTLIAMRLRGVPYGMIVDSRIMAVKAGLNLTINQLEEHYLAEGSLIPTIQALIAAEKAGMDLTWKQACAIDLATKGTGKTVVEAVRTSINPKVISFPYKEVADIRLYTPINWSSYPCSDSNNSSTSTCDLGRTSK